MSSLGSSAFDFVPAVDEVDMSFWEALFIETLEGALPEEVEALEGAFLGEAEEFSVWFKIPELPEVCDAD